MKVNVNRQDLEIVQRFLDELYTCHVCGRLLGEPAVQDEPLCWDCAGGDDDDEHNLRRLARAAREAVERMVRP